MESRTLVRIKFGQKIDKPSIKVRTVSPTFWDPSSNVKYAEAVVAWRRGKNQENAR